jgi:hypothetical protein
LKAVVVVMVVIIAGAVRAGAAPAARQSGKVAYSSGGLLYLDKGTSDGVVVGGRVDVLRRKRAVVPCEVVHVAAHHAACKPASPVDVGERFAFDPRASGAEHAEQVRPRPPLSTVADLAARREKLEARPVTPLPYQGPRTVEGAIWSGRAALTLRHQSFVTIGEGVGFQRSSIDAAARATVGWLPGLYLSGAGRVQSDWLVPEQHRTRPDELAELYLWEALAGFDAAQIPVVGVLGRFRPAEAPGASMIDGAQVGLRLWGGALRTGVYGGLVPDVLTLAPTPGRFTAGGYAGVQWQPFEALLVLPRARAAIVGHTPGLGLGDTMAAEVEGQTQLVVASVVQAGIDARASLDTTAMAFSLDAVRADLSVTPGSVLAMRLGYRYLAPRLWDVDLAPQIPPVTGAHHGEASVGWRPVRWFSATALGFGALDLNNGAMRGLVGPELGLPELFGGYAGLSVMMLEELGSLHAGRFAAATLTVRPASVLSISLRGSGSEAATTDDPVREGSLAMLIDAPLFTWLSFRLGGQLLTTMPTLVDMPRAAPTGLLLDASVTGAL